jgi:hypothetical protein
LVGGVGTLTAARVGLFRGDSGGLILALLAGLLGAALAGFLFEAVAPRLLLQVRSGFIRCGITRFGATLSGGAWSRLPLLTPAMKRNLGGLQTQMTLSREEREWLLALRESTATASSRLTATAMAGTA